MNKHGQRRKETCPCTANLTFLVQNYIFLSIIPQIYRDNCGFLPLPKCKKAGYGTRKTTPGTKARISPRRLHQSYFPQVRAHGNKVHGLEKQEGQQRAVLKDVPQLRIRKKCVTTQKIRMKTPEQANNSGFMGYSTLIYPHIQY